MLTKMLNFLQRSIKYYGILLGLGAYLFHLWTAVHPHWVEKYFSRGVYEIVRDWAHWMRFLNFLPGILWAILLLLIIPFLWAFAKKSKARSSFGYWFLFTVNRVGVLVFCFYILWGYNYDRVPYIDQVGLDLSIPIESERMRMEAWAVRDRLIRSGEEFHSMVDHDGEALSSRALSVLMQMELKSSGYPARHPVHISRWIPGSLLRLSTAGMYIPHALQGNVDGGLHELQRPFTTLHEMSHSYGITHEGVANLLAYLAGRRSDDPYVLYSVELGYFRYLASDLRQSDPEFYTSYSKEIPDFVWKDLKSIRDQMARYPDIMPTLQRAVYDQYLKSHGIQDGVYSYNQMVKMVIATASLQKVKNPR